MKKKKQADTEKPVQEEHQEKKVKVVYIDDNSTIADMSSTHKNADRPPRPKSSFREKARTFFSAQKKMILPMLSLLAALGFVYLLIMAVTGNLW